MTTGPMMQRCGTCGEQWWDAHCCPKQNSPMTLAGFFDEAKRLNLRMLGTPEETRAALDLKDAEIARLTAALKKANDQAERFERGWYLRGDALETALEDLGQATSFASKKARDRHAKTLETLSTALGPNVRTKLDPTA